MTSVLKSEPRPANTPTTDKLAGLVAFVTGGTRGIGASIAHSLAGQGATVAVGYDRDRAADADAAATGVVAKCNDLGLSGLLVDAGLRWLPAAIRVR